MVSVGLLVRMQAKPGKETDVENFLRGGLPLVQEEPATVAWFGIRLGPSTFGIFDVFPDEAGRQAHLAGKVACSALMEKLPSFSNNLQPLKKSTLWPTSFPLRNNTLGERQHIPLTSIENLKIVSIMFPYTATKVFLFAMDILLLLLLILFMKVSTSI